MNVIHRAPLMGGGKAYQLNDDFLDDRAAGALNGTPATPGPGLRTVVDTYASTELVTNGGFETVTSAGPPVNFGTWTEVVSDGNIEAATGVGEFHAGTYGCKLTAGAALATRVITGAFTVIPGRTYAYSFWTRGDGTNAGRHYAYDFTNGVGITALVSTGVTGTTYAQVTGTFTAPATCTQAQIVTYCPPVNGGVAYFDDVSCLPTTGLLSIANGLLSVAGGMATAVWGTPRLTYPSMTRVTGNYLTTYFTPISGVWALGLGDGNGATPTLAAIKVNGTTLQVLPNVVPSGTAISVGTLTMGVRYQLAIDLRSAGAHKFIRGGTEYPTWTYLWGGTAFNANPVYPGMWNYSGAFTLG